MSIVAESNSALNLVESSIPFFDLETTTVKSDVLSEEETTMQRRILSVLCVSIAMVLALAPIATADEVAVEAKPMTLSEAVASLGNLEPGEHKMVFMHPYTCCPVEVCFCLPCGCYCVKCEQGLCGQRLRFKYPGLFNDVVLKFKNGGKVKVRD